MATTVDMVRVFLGTRGARDVDEDALAMAVDAANAVIVVLRPEVAGLADPLALLAGEPDGDGWPANVTYAATMYAAQLYGRRGALFGTLNYQEMAVNMRTVDPHIYALLELGLNQRSVVA
jgi:hypothetical protein